ncbi:sigma-54-dependent transcriptional regulator [Archangium lipolyticum]|uniref:sigma-54-dependent transcriptional regulator n=1 Tax=Archangium lipolyticum TaxID=2970465 RepID=UPI002149D3AB|nr:sigma-54 dependent transcriptional regulator [Archangium lipolyticum]
MLKTLIVDDQAAVRTALEVLFDLHGLPTLVASSPQEALDLVAAEDVGVVVQDMNFTEATTSGHEGLQLLRDIKRLDPDLPVVAMTAWTSLEMAVQLIKEGASDYQAKPWDDTKLVNTVKNLMRLRELSLENTRLRAGGARARAELARKHDLRGVIYASPTMHEVVSLVVKVAPADVPVLISGPNGAGKEQVAEMVQANSRRKAGPFVKVNCGGLPDQLLEAELFGAEPGAYTGAMKLRVGRFEEAHGGTLFLDEIGNLSPAGQAKLLRVLQLGEFQRLGSNVTRKVDVRVISATNVDLPRAIQEGNFREDLYFRLAVIEVKLPALKDRPEDVPVLAEHFLQHFQPEGEALHLGASARQALLAHDWPGNVRELQNRIQRAVLVRKGTTLEAADLGLSEAGQPEKSASEHAPVPAALSEEEAQERATVERALAEAQGVVSRAAAQLGLSRQALYRRMERLGLSVERRLKG